jgi:hypothetical protein
LATNSANLQLDHAGRPSNDRKHAADAKLKDLLCAKVIALGGREQPEQARDL